MSTLTLHASPTSPYARKVRALILETGQSDDIRESAASGTPLDPGTAPLALNPLGKIPVLERPGAGALYDSRVICRFLDDRARAGLYPAPPRLWDTLTLEATADGIMDAALLMVYEGRLRPEAHHFAPFVDGQWSKIARALDTLEARWGAYLAGPLCIGQIALGCALGYLDFRHGARDWRQGRDGLARWEAMIAARPAMMETRPPA